MLLKANETKKSDGLWLRFRYYSMYGHVEKMAEEMKKGALSIEGVEVSLFQVNSTPFSTGCLTKL